MRRLLALSSVILGFCFAQGAAARYVKVFQYGAWNGFAFFADDNGAFNLCAIGADYKSGMTMYFALYPAGSWQLLFSRQQGFSGGSTAFSLFVDDRYVYGGSGAPDPDGKLLRINIPLSTDVINALKHGGMLRVVSPYGDASFSLKSTSGAIAELARCVINRGWQQSAGNAFGPGATAGAAGTASAGSGEKQPYVLPRAQLISYASEILRDTGLSDYRFLPEQQTSGPQAVTWQFEDGSMGSLLAVGNADSMDLDKLIGEAMSNDTSGCKGDAANGKRVPHYVNGLEVRKFFTSCKAGAQSFYAEYSLVRLPEGTIVRIMSALFGENAFSGALGNPGTPSFQDRMVKTEEAALTTFSKR